MTSKLIKLCRISMNSTVWSSVTLLTVLSIPKPAQCQCNMADQAGGSLASSQSAPTTSLTTGQPVNIRKNSSVRSD